MRQRVIYLELNESLNWGTFKGRTVKEIIDDPKAIWFIPWMLKESENWNIIYKLNGNETQDYYYERRKLCSQLVNSSTVPCDASFIINNSNQQIKQP